MPSEKTQNLQDAFLNHVRKQKVPVTIFLVNGVKLQGVITWFDNFCLLLRRDAQSQLVYKHAISTIMPGAPIQLFDPEHAERRLTADHHDDEFDDEAVRKGGPQAFIDQRAAPTRVGLIVPDVRGRATGHSIEARKAEFEGLAEAIRVEIVFSEVVKVREIKPATFIGGGHVEDIRARGSRQRRSTCCWSTRRCTQSSSAISRRKPAPRCSTAPALILEIFGERAATREGVLQVELAHLNYQKSRLVRSWTHLERQRGSGGFGFMGGPGETQIESDRRQMQDRIVLLEDRIEKVRKTRGQQKGKRDAVPFQMVALVGYTNAGKSSIFNALTGAGVFAKDLLFATLDTTVRKIELPHGREVMLCDTVGFVADLPTDLVAAFRATLEEVLDADVILHVRDIANPDHAAQAPTCSRCWAISAFPPKRRRSSKSGTRSTCWRAMPTAPIPRWRHCRRRQGGGDGAGIGADRRGAG